MFDDFLDIVKKIVKSRLLPICIIFMVMFGILINRLFVLQIVEGQTHTETILYKNVKDREIKSTRGNIYDRNGNLLAYNTLSYSVQIEDTGELGTNAEKNSMIHKLINILEENGNTIAYEFYIMLNEYGELEFTVTDNALLRFKKNVYGLRYVSELEEEHIDANAYEVFEYLRKGSGKVTTMFNISDEYNIEETLKIMTIRYALYMNSFQKYLPVTIAKGIDEVTVAAISEYKDILRGVDIIQETHRVYNDSTYFSHIIGYTGLISQDELDVKNEEGSDYTVTDTIGKSGIEKAYEDYLHGSKGYENVLVDSFGRVLDVMDVVEPVAGSGVYLTIDREKQIAYYKILEKKIAGILISKIVNSTSAGEEKDILIPIYDVYFALIDNNIINIKSFEDEEATELEMEVYKKFKNKQREVINNLTNLLKSNNTTSINSLSEETQKYVSYIYSTLVSKEIIKEKEINSDDVKYIAYKSGKIGISELLQHLIFENWIDITKLNISNEYYSTEELYKELVNYIIKVLTQDNSFNKLLYRKMIDTFNLSGKDICLLLFDQKVLKYNREEITKLSNGTLSPYSFIINKLTNLEITPADLALDPHSGSLIVTDVNTGDVLAMVSYPSYDNNKFANTVDAEYFNKLQNDKSRPLYNISTYSRSAPGSTFKMVTSIAGLEERVIGEAELILDEREFDKVTPPAKCWIHPRSHGNVKVNRALEVSCNYFYYEVGYRLSIESTGKFNSQLGLDKLAKYAGMFGFDKKSGIELPEVDPKLSDESPVRSAIGQGSNSFTPAQIARYITTVANKGTCYDLTILDKVIAVDGTLIEDNNAQVNNIVKIKPTTWNLVHEGMYRVTHGSEGTLRKTFAGIEVPVAAKTGTAQEDLKRPNHALCVAYAPYDNPEIAITVVIRNGYASGNAAEAVRDVVKSYFKLATEDEILESSAIPDDGHASMGD